MATGGLFHRWTPALTPCVHHPHHSPRILGPLSAALPATAALGSWPALRPAPATCLHAGMQMGAMGMRMKAETLSGVRMAGGGHNRHGGLHGHMGLRGGPWHARRPGSARYLLHAGGSYHRGRRSERASSAPGALRRGVICTSRQRVPGAVAPADNPKIGEMGLERAANVRRDGPVPVAERCCAAGDLQRLPCPKSEAGAMEPWGVEIKIEQA